MLLTTNGSGFFDNLSCNTWKCTFWSEFGIWYSATNNLRLKSFAFCFLVILSKYFLSKIRLIRTSIMGPTRDVFRSPRNFTVSSDVKYLSATTTKPRLYQAVGIMNSNRLTSPDFQSSNWVGQTGAAEKINKLLSQSKKYLSPYFYGFSIKSIIFSFLIDIFVIYMSLRSFWYRFERFSFFPPVAPQSVVNMENLF